MIRNRGAFCKRQVSPELGIEPRTPGPSPCTLFIHTPIASTIDVMTASVFIIGNKRYGLSTKPANSQDSQYVLTGTLSQVLHLEN